MTMINSEYRPRPERRFFRLVFGGDVGVVLAVGCGCGVRFFIHVISLELQRGEIFLYRIRIFWPQIQGGPRKASV